MSSLGIMSRKWICRATTHACAQHLLQLLLTREMCHVYCINLTLAIKISWRLLLLLLLIKISWRLAKSRPGDAMSAASVKVFQIQRTRPANIKQACHVTPQNTTLAYRQGCHANRTSRGTCDWYIYNAAACHG